MVRYDDGVLNIFEEFGFENNLKDQDDDQDQ